MKSFKTLSLILVLVLTLFACGNEPTNNTTDTSPEASTNITTYAVVATVASDWSSGAHSVLSYSKPRTATNDLLPTISDIAVSSYGEYFYRIERFNADNVTKFNIDAPDTPIWQFSTMDSNDSFSSSNPYTLVFASQTKAYLLRYGSQRAWIVNPSATTEENFKIGELDLSSYDEGDGVPEMSSGVIVGNKLFIVMQRLNNWALSDPAYIAVFDTTTDTEIATGQGSGGLKGIELSIRNPDGKIRYYDGYLYVAGAGNLWSGDGTYGGIQRINTSTYEADSNVIYQGSQITDIAIVSETKGYFIESISAAWGSEDTALGSFNPQTGAVNSGNVAGIGDTGDRYLLDLAVDNDGYLWVADITITNPGIYIIDTTTDTTDEGPISTNLNPVDITFCHQID